MQFSQLLALVVAAAAGNTFAAPTEGGEAHSMMAAASTWTIQNFKRVCNAGDNQCSFTYSINTNNGAAPHACSYKVSGSPASEASYSGLKCGAFTIGSSWSDQFGLSKAYTTLSVVKGSQIIYPSYTDAQLDSEKVVKPNQSYTPQNLS